MFYQLISPLDQQPPELRSFLSKNSHSDIEQITPHLHEKHPHTQYQYRNPTPGDLKISKTTLHILYKGHNGHIIINTILKNNKK